jgi:cellulose synthase/poly-beta-1,6-N-acetylglucosamine synthase-like glycosyltransferase
MEVTLWLLVSLVVYHHVVYPLVVACFAKHFGHRQVPPSFDPANLPTMTVIVPAHNELAVIDRKIENLRTLNYPHDGLTIVIACDGCSDGTTERARLLVAGRKNWKVVERKRNIGKIRVLNELIADANSDIVVLTDASAVVNPDALRIAAAHFADPSVGVVCATYVLGPNAPLAEEAYWRYQTRIKLAESALAAPIGAHGAFYLCRRRLWSELPEDTINDDVILPMQIVRKGYRCIYEPAIVATELEASRPQTEFRRRVRIGAGNWQQAVWLFYLAHPAWGWLAFVYLSGKFLRALMPPILAGIVVVTALAAQSSILFQVLLAAIGMLCLLAVAVPAQNRVSYVFLSYVAAGLGIVLQLGGFGSKVWRLSSSSNARRSKSLQAGKGDLC